MHLTDFCFDMNPTALRKAKIVYNFGLSECNRVKRKTIVLSKDIKIIFFCNIFLFFEVSKVGISILRKIVVVFLLFFFKFSTYLPTLFFFSGCNLIHTYFFFIWPSRNCN